MEEEKPRAGVAEIICKEPLSRLRTTEPASLTLKKLTDRSVRSTSPDSILTSGGTVVLGKEMSVKAGSATSVVHAKAVASNNTLIPAPRTATRLTDSLPINCFSQYLFTPGRAVRIHC